MRGAWVSWLGLLAACVPGWGAAVVGVRPYELDWAGRTQDARPPLVDFETLTGWTVETESAVASFEATREQQIWGEAVGKLTYRATGPNPLVRLRPPQPMPIPGEFDALSCWVYGNNWAWVADKTTPQVAVRILLRSADGKEIGVPLWTVCWREWFLCQRRPQPEQLAALQTGASFSGIEIQNGRNREDRVLYFDNLAVFKEEMAPLTFQPRPQRGVSMFPGQGSGTNTGPGVLPFPTRPETILPTNLAMASTSTVRQEGAAFLFEYKGDDGVLTYRYEPATGTWSDLTAQWQGRGGVFRPLAGGGVRLVGANGEPIPPEKLTVQRVELAEGAVSAAWQAAAGEQTAAVSYTFRLWGKTLVLDTACRGGLVSEVRYGRAEGLEKPRLVGLPYYDYGGSRPSLVVSGPPEAPLFLAGHTDWYRSNGSTPWAENAVEGSGAAYQGGVRYLKLTNGQRNDCYERFFVTVTPRFEEALPTVANPASGWKQVTGKGVWNAHGANDREGDKRHWRNVYRHGMRHVIVTDHETGWRDGGESFTFRTRTAPGKGGDEGQFRYARFMQDELGFVYGPYNNYTDFSPVNEYWSTDLIARDSQSQLVGAWARCYAPKPARAVEYCAELAPKIQAKFRFSTAYCDVHTAVAPWHRVDCDQRVPGAGTFAATFYAYGEIMLLQKQAWNGPVYSEGGKHAYYCGLTDGNYAQDQAYDLPNNPWLVDFDLLKLHDLCCNFGMGNLEMFFGKRQGLGATPAAAQASVDRFLAATIAFGHPGFLVFEGGLANTMRSYYMVQQLAARYTQVAATGISYVDSGGRQMGTTEAVARDVFRRSQVVVRYADGTITAANGHISEPLVTEIEGRRIELPPQGYTGWSADGQITVFSGLAKGQRCDYAETPEYLFLDGRGQDVRFPKAGGAGLAACLISDAGWEVIPWGPPDCGFALAAGAAVALAADGKELGPAELRRARGLTFVMPVAGALSYRLSAGPAAAGVELVSERLVVAPGESIAFRGREEHRFSVPADAVPGTRLWQPAEGAWIDFWVAPLAEVTAALAGEVLRVTLRSNLPGSQPTTVSGAGVQAECRLESGKVTDVALDLGKPTDEEARVLTVNVRAGELSLSREWGLETRLGYVPLSLPKSFRSGLRSGSGAETFSLGSTGAQVNVRVELSCGDVIREGLFMHPPWMDGAYGYSFALYEGVALPGDVPTAFRAFVGKLDGSFLGDGILYRVCVVTADGQETAVATQTVTEHCWLPIEADLTRWAGQTIALKLIADDGLADNTSGDWAAWGDLRLETLEPRLVRTLTDSAAPFRREPGPSPVPGLTLEQLRTATAGQLFYEGKGLSGTGEHGTVAILNGVVVGAMAAAGGRETEGVFSAPVSVALTPEAIRSLRWWNTFEIDNSRQDYYSVRRFWISLELSDGRRCTSDLTPTTFTQPGSWAHAEGVPVAMDQRLSVGIWFPR
jgi:hypothetical protein